MRRRLHPLNCRVAAALQAALLCFTLATATPGRVGAGMPLEMGAWAEAAVVASGPGWVTSEIDLKGGGRDYHGSLTGPIESVSPGQLALLHQSVAVDAATALKDSTGANLALADFRPGDFVEVRLLRHGTTWHATRIKRRGAGDMEIEGPVEALNGSEDPALRLLGIDIALAADLVVRTPPRRATPVRDLQSDDDLIGRELFALGALRVSAVAGVTVGPRHNYDLDRSRAGDQTNSDFSGRLEGSARLGERWRAFGRVSSFGRVVLADQKGTRRGALQGTLDEAWLLASGLGRRDLALQVGRQRLFDRHEWLSDAYLDAARLHFSGTDTWGELSVSTRLGAATTANTETWNILAAANRSLDRNFDVGAYVLHRAARAGGAGGRRTWSGVRLLQLRTGRFSGWGELTWLSGRDRGYRLEGRAIHLNGGLLLERAHRLRLNAQYARGSGDRKLGDGVDGNFHQTGLADNNDRFGGVTRFKFYGELFLPELSNLEVLSAGIGMRPTAASSIDIVGHRYRQAVPLPLQEGIDVDALPLGTDRALGHEVDIIVGVREFRSLKIEALAGVFRAGPAFADRLETAFTSRLQLNVSF